MAELVSVNAEAYPAASALKEVGNALDVDRPAVTEQQEVLTGAVGSHSVHVAQELATQPVGHRHSTEFGALPSPDLEEHALAVVFDILQLQRAQFAEAHPGSKQDLDGKD